MKPFLIQDVAELGVKVLGQTSSNIYMTHHTFTHSSIFPFATALSQIIIFAQTFSPAKKDGCAFASVLILLRN
jgi:hypothetical protein